MPNGPPLICNRRWSSLCSLQPTELRMVGTAAVVGMARAKGLIPSARQVFDTLHRSDFRISAEVIRTVLTRVAEG